MCTDIERSLEASLAFALSNKDIRKSTMLGLQTVRYLAKDTL